MLKLSLYTILTNTSKILAWFSIYVVPRGDLSKRFARSPGAKIQINDNCLRGVMHQSGTSVYYIVCWNDLITSTYFYRMYV